MKRLAIVIAALMLVVAACGDGEDVGDAGPVTTGDGASGPVTTTTQSPVTTLPPADAGSTTTTLPTATQFVDVYFIQDGQYATAVATRVPATPEIASNAIRALIAGPTETQQEIGLSSSVPTDTLLLGITIEDGLATVDLSREFEAGGGSFAMITRLAQVVYTLTQFPTVDEVEFWLDGQPVTVFSSEGLLLEDPVARADYLTAVPLTPTMLDEIERWEQADLPAGVGPDVRTVVLVAEDDVLNVRIAPGVSNEKIGMLAPGVVVALTGPQIEVGSSTWVEIATPAGAGWVNDHFLAEILPFGSDEFPGDEVIQLIQALSDAIAAEGEIGEFVSSGGLYVAHHDAPIRFSQDELAGILTDPTTYKWPSNALNVNDPDEAKEIPDRTFAEAVADRFNSTWDDPDRITTVDEPIQGGNGRIPEYAIPFEFGEFHYIGVYDPGDNPDYGGLDWTIWYVSIVYEDGAPLVVGLTLDEWSP